MLVDPMPNRAGLAPRRQGLSARRCARSRATVGALLIFDEVITFRLGYRGAQGIWAYRSRSDHARQDHGRRLSGRRGRRQARKSWRCSIRAAGKPALPHGGTFSANPVTMRAGHRGDGAARRCRLRAARRDRRGGAQRHRRRLPPPRRARPHRRARVAAKDSFCRSSGPRLSLGLSTEAGSAASAIFNRGLLNRGVLAAGYGLMALSTPMTDPDIETIVTAASEAIAEVVGLRPP